MAENIPEEVNQVILDLACYISECNSHGPTVGAKIIYNKFIEPLKKEIDHYHKVIHKAIENDEQEINNLRKQNAELQEAIKTFSGGMKEEAVKQIWNMALSYCSNICTLKSNDWNNDDYIQEAMAANECAKDIQKSLDHVHPDVYKGLDESGGESSKFYCAEYDKP